MSLDSDNIIKWVLEIIDDAAEIHQRLNESLGLKSVCLGLNPKSTAF